MKAEMEFGPYLKQLRESQEMSLRDVAKKAGVSSGYLSQIEGGKRGKRKSGEMFAPHPQLLQRLASVYHVDAHDIFQRAGYLEDSSYRGFPEERELDRCFDFVIHDPALKQVLTPQDKRAVISRYEKETGRKVLTWTPPPTALQNKSSYQGLRLEADRLYAEPVDMALTVAEVGEELKISEVEVLKLVANDHLHARPGNKGEPPTFSRLELYGFQTRVLALGMDVAKRIDAKHVSEAAHDYEDDLAQVGVDILRTKVEEATQEAKSKLAPRRRTPKK